MCVCVCVLFMCDTACTYLTVYICMCVHAIALSLMYIDPPPTAHRQQWYSSLALRDRSLSRDDPGGRGASGPLCVQDVWIHPLTGVWVVNEILNVLYMCVCTII